MATMKLQTFLLPEVTLTSAGNPAPEFGGLTVIDWTVKLAGETHTEVISDGQLIPWQLSYSMSTSTVNVVPALAAYLADTSHELYPRGYAAHGLEEIGNWHPESRSEVIAALSKQLESFEENDYELNGFLISGLSRLKAVEALPLIERAFAADRVDEFVINLDSVLVELGLKEREEIQIQDPLAQLFERRGTPLRPDQITIVPPDTSQIRPSTQKTTGKPIKFSGKRITKKRRKKK